MDIKEFRKRLNMTQSQLASEAGITQEYLSQIETGKKRNPSIIVLRKLAFALKITLSELLGEKSA